MIVRIARSADHLPAVRREVRVSRWLERVGFPAARVLDDVEQPLVVDGHPVTFWYRIDEGDRDATYGELGAVLRDLHALAVPDEPGLERLPVLGRTAVRMERAIGVPEDDLAFLRQRGRELEGLLSELRFESPVGPLHGDAHTGNPIVDRAGRVFLIDLENFCLDHPEWDLIVAAHEYHSLGWASSESYADISSERTVVTSARGPVSRYCAQPRSSE